MVVGVLISGFRPSSKFDENTIRPFLSVPRLQVSIQQAVQPKEYGSQTLGRVDLRFLDSEIFLFGTLCEWGESRHCVQARQLPKKLSYHEVVDLGPVRGEY